MRDPIDRLLHDVRRRQRLAQTAVLLGRVALPFGLSLAAVAVATARLLGESMGWAWVAVLAVPGVILWAQLRPRSLRAAARAVDESHGYQDVIGNAFELQGRARSDDPKQAAIIELLADEAARLARGVDPRTVVPIRIGPPRRIDAIAALVLFATVYLPEPKLSDPPSEPRRTPGMASANPSANKGFDLTLVEPVRNDLRSLTEGDDPAAETAAALLELLEALEAGTLDRREAFARIDQLESLLAAAEEQFDAGLEDDAAMLAEAMWKLAQSFEQEPLTQPVASALETNAGEQAQKAFEHAGQQAEQDGADGAAMERALTQAERQLNQSARNQSPTAEALADAERRLKQQQKSPATDPAEQERRLKQMQRRLEQLRRQHEREMATQRRLEQLRREAQQSRGQNRQGRTEARNRLGQGMRQASEVVRSAQRMGRARDSLEEVKSFVRRAGRKGDAKGRRRGQMRQFMDAAESKGDSKKGGKSTLLIEGKVDGDDMALIENEGQGRPQDEQGNSEGQGDPSGADTQQQAAIADGMGEGTDETMLDTPESRETKTKDVKVDATRGTGASRAEVIRTSSQEGFASEPYREVYQDYRSFAQSALDNESVPASQRRQVKRYFQLIQPRE